MVSTPCGRSFLPSAPIGLKPDTRRTRCCEQFYAYGAMGVVMLAGLYGSVYRRIRKLPRGPVRVVFLSILLFVVVRGFAEAEPFDLLLPCRSSF